MNNISDGASHLEGVPSPTQILKKCPVTMRKNFPAEVSKTGTCARYRFRSSTKQQTQHCALSQWGKCDSCKSAVSQRWHKSERQRLKRSQICLIPFLNTAIKSVRELAAGTTEVWLSGDEHLYVLNHIGFFGWSAFSKCFFYTQILGLP